MRPALAILVFLIAFWLIAPALCAAEGDGEKPADGGKAEKPDPPPDDDTPRDKPDGDDSDDDDKGDDDGGGRDNPPIPEVEVKRININVYPHDVILIKGKMVEWDEVRDHLDKLVEDARKDAVEVTLIPFSPEQMSEVAAIIKIAKSVGYTRVNFISAKRKKKEITEILILVSRSGVMVVNDAIVQPAGLKTHLEELIPAERREKVPVLIFAGSQTSRRNVSAAVKAARDAGFKDVQFGPIGD